MLRSKMNNQDDEFSGNFVVERRAQFMTGKVTITACLSFNPVREIERGQEEKEYRNTIMHLIIRLQYQLPLKPDDNSMQPHTTDRHATLHHDSIYYRLVKAEAHINPNLWISDAKIG